jgi:hypothetical protein
LQQFRKAEFNTLVEAVARSRRPENSGQEIAICYRDPIATNGANVGRARVPHVRLVHVRRSTLNGRCDRRRDTIESAGVNAKIRCEVCSSKATQIMSDVGADHNHPIGEFRSNSK